MADRVRTLREMLAELQAFARTNPSALEHPLGFTLDRGEALERGEGTIWFARGLIADDAGAALLTRGSVAD